MAVADRLDDHDNGPVLYLVFAGLHLDARRGSGDLVAVTASLEEARAAFRSVRLRLADRQGWGELAAVSDGEQPRVLGWFGADRWPRPNRLAPMLRESGTVVPLHSRRARRASLRQV